MKNTVRQVFATLALLSLILCSACGLAGQKISDADKPAASPSDAAATDTQEPSVPASAPVPSDTPVSTGTSAEPDIPAAASVAPSSASDLMLEEKAYTDGSVKIKYPQITGMSNNAAQDKLNLIIADTALRDVKTLESGTEYELSYKVTLNKPSVISMYFEGYSNIPGTIHPNRFLYTLTLDIKKQEAIKLPQLVSINDGLVKILLNAKVTSMSYDMTSEYETAIKENLTQFDTDFWLDELRNADTAGYTTLSYISDTKLYISVSVPHVMGDHVELVLPFEDLQGYLTDNLIWKDILNYLL